MKRTARLNITEAEAKEWAEVMSKYFAKIQLCAHLEILRATPAIEMKKMAMESIIKKLAALDT